VKLIYFHGFASSGASGTVDLLRRLLPSAEVIAPDISMDPAEALPELQALVESEQPDLIIGASMGGMYAAQMHGHLRICVNPAFHMSALSRVLKTGTHRYLNGRKDRVREFQITRDTLRHYADMERRQFDGITAQDRELCYGLFGTKDDTVNPANARGLFLKHYAHAAQFEGGHQLNEQVVRRAVLPLVAKLLPEAYAEAIKPPVPDYMKGICS